MKARLKRLLPRSDFARGVSVLAGGTAAAQVLMVAVSPLLTRLYSPEDFGLLAVYAGLLATISVISSLRYELAIPLAESDREAASVAMLSTLITVGMSLLTAVIVWHWGDSIVAVLRTPSLAPYLWLLPVGVLLVGIYGVLNYWAIRTRAFPAIARTKLTQALASVTVQIGGFAFGPVALLVAQVSGQAAGATSLTRLTVRPNWRIFQGIRGCDMTQAAVRWRRFPLYSTWSGLFNTAGTQLPPILFAALFNPAVAGIYMLAQRVLGMPMQLLGQAIAQVFFARSAEARRKGELAPLVAGIHEKLAQVAMPPALIVLLAGPDLFSFVFGASWRQAGEFAQWMAPWLYLVFVTSPLSQLFNVLERQSSDVMFQGVLFAARLGSLIVGGLTGNLMFTVALFSLAGAACWVGFLIWIIRASGNSYRTLFNPSLKAGLISLLLVSPFTLHLFVGEGPSVWLIAMALSVVLISMRYFLLLKRAW